MSDNSTPAKGFEDRGQRADSLRMRKARAVTPNDSTDLAFGITIAINVTVAGNVVIQDANGETQAAVFLAAGMLHPIEARRIMATNTTATGIVAIY